MKISGGIKANDVIFIAGSNGMVGSAITRLLKDNIKKNHQSNILLTPSRDEIDLCSYDSVFKWFEEYKPNIIINAAAKVGGINANYSFPVEFLLNNLKIQNNIIEASYRFNARRLLFLGSSCIYPKNCKQPIKEEYLMSSPLESTNEYYALAKISGLKLCEAYRKQYDFDAISLMPTNLYGPGDNYHPQNSHVLPALIWKFYNATINNISEVTCWGSGNPLREFLHVDDLARACIFAINNWDPSKVDRPTDSLGKPLNWLNVGSNDEISIRDLALKIAKIFNYKGEIRWDKSKPDGTFRKKLDTSQMEKLGWNPLIDLDEGIKGTIDSFKNQIINKNLRNI
tara:strand:- start:122 stop:1144 length:1023 start_codon:yes stop_codon:yes gene_type:complete